MYIYTSNGIYLMATPSFHRPLRISGRAKVLDDAVSLATSYHTYNLLHHPINSISTSPRSAVTVSRDQLQRRRLTGPVRL